MILREIKVDFSSEVPIIDIEISNDISVPRGQGDWKYQEGDIISCAVLYGNKITVLFREKEDKIGDYKAKLRELLDKLPTMYSFNFKMEKYSFLGFLGRSYFIEEIKPWMGAGWGKQQFFLELVKDKKVKKKDIPRDPLEDDSGLCLQKYSNGDYESIINHNIADVIKQYFIWKNKIYLLEKYKDSIDSAGWFGGGR